VGKKSKSKSKSKFNINISNDDSELNDFLYCWGEFGSRPNKLIIYNSYLKESFLKVVKNYNSGRNRHSEIIPSLEHLTINDKVLLRINNDIYLSYIIIDRLSDTSVIHDIIFFFKDDSQLEFINKLIEELNSCIFDSEIEEDDRFNTISLSQNGIELESINLPNLDEEIDFYYDVQTLKDVNRLIKSINKSDKGLSFLYGPRGTGKTSIINYLVSKLDKMIIFIPNNMIEMTINNPEFKSFLNRHPNSLLLIDDCESIFSQLFTRSNIITNNLLQIVDGPLSDNYNINILMIFNTESEDDIDESLTECNNLIGKVNFELLDKDSSNKLSNHINSGKKYKNKSKLIDIIKKRNPDIPKKIGIK
jgi:hypothetical protein